jgi:S-ribosylhomocysteine lyase LuxS involved in autoinducer biosynthesis
MSTKPTFEQAQLQLQVFDQRRETKLRQARDWFFKNFHPTSFDDAMRIAPMGSETGTYVSMVIGYWEQACALLNYDLLHEDLFFETTGEFFGVWETLKPTIPGFRERFVSKTACANLEKAAQRYEKWIEARSPGHVEAMRGFMKQMQGQTAKAA